MAQEVSEPSLKSEIVRDKKKGFSIGPDNLPDGVHRRKVRKIKQNLIRKAQIKKSYNKIKSREPELHGRAGAHADIPNEGGEVSAPASLELHPERQAMLDDPGYDPSHSQSRAMDPQRRQRPPRQPRPDPFKKEVELASRRKDEREAQQQAFEEADRERERKRGERERFRKAMAKARTGGRDGGQRKLGRESKILLEKVQRMMDN